MSTVQDEPYHRMNCELNRGKTTLCLRLDNLYGNLQTIAARVGGVERIIAVLKANAYGFGARRMAAWLENCQVRSVAVANVEEAMILRRTGWKWRIMLFASFQNLSDEELTLCRDHDLEPTAGAPDCSLYMSPFHTQYAGLKLHINIDTGMNRYGDAMPLKPSWHRMKRMQDQFASFYTHLPAVTPNDIAEVRKTIRQFSEQVAEKGEFPLHVASTAAIALLDPEELLRFEYSRVGLGLYGYLPDRNYPDIGLIPILEIKTETDLIRNVRTGETLSYGGEFRCERDSKIAVIPFGYSHGLPVKASGQLSFDVKGVRVPQVGRITMDSCLVDVTDVPDLQFRETVTILGHQSGASTVYDWCEASNSHPWEILTRIGEPTCAHERFAE